MSVREQAGEDSFSPGQRLGKYELLATIGQGGMAKVILARQRGIGGFERAVVIKVIHPHLAHDKAVVNMLLDEARLAAQIVHHNVVQTYELDEAHGTFYIVMEYLAGESLAQVIKRALRRTNLVPPRYAAHLIANVCEGLHAAHEAVDVEGNRLGVIHRDISPGNIVVLYSGTVKLVDFGIAKAQGRVTSTADGELKGKYGYMPPEQIMNEPMDRRSDVFSLGVVLWELLAHRRCFYTDNVGATLMQILHAPRIAPSTLDPDVPPGLDAIALRALAVDPRDRFDSAAAMKRALDDLPWKARCGASDVGSYMTELFADRIEQRRSLLARTRHDDPRIKEILDALDEEHEPQAETGVHQVRAGDLVPLAAAEVATVPGVGPQPLAPPTARTTPMAARVRATEPVVLGVSTPPRKRSKLVWWMLGASLVVAGAVAATLGFGDDHGDLSNEVAVSAPASVSSAAQVSVDPIESGVGELAGAGEPAAVAEPSPAGEPAVIAEPARVAEPAAVAEPGTEPAVIAELPPATPAPTTPAERTRREAARRARIDAVAPAIDEPSESEEPADVEPPVATPTPAPASIDELYKQATAHHLAGHFAAAAAAFTDLLAIDPKHAAAQRGRGMAYQRMGYTAKALDAFRAYLALRPGAADADAIRARIADLEAR